MRIQIFASVSRGVPIPLNVVAVGVFSRCHTAGITMPPPPTTTTTTTTKTPPPQHHQPKQFFNQLMSIVRAQPSPACCAAVYQTARLLHLWDRAREVLQLWDGLPSFGASEDARRSSRLSNRRLTDAKLDGAAILTSLEGMSSSSGLLKRGSSSTESNEDGDTGGVAVDVYEAILFFCKADVEARPSYFML